MATVIGSVAVIGISRHPLVERLSATLYIVTSITIDFTVISQLSGDMWLQTGSEPIFAQNAHFDQYSQEDLA
ncbi:hypothetical protein N7491_003991 [Penicillium cf. griseofulvum]|uniref:Uncharacterized protein n=1 Tax=Penicillium cf. griseofulvum TaxID=2972120 RepID=A0A9W9T1E8_9EURO|nr:hypothetical protein N7472_001833 [Penicillium cf. griseofulvum]KAJ5437439.1 hypothetical protein N7445_005983 [Penicillium cf. griseofulvum]KAJ5441585.1 hypothetical protein N7491_003991 [Penicillium cf. griseofulvum]